MRATKRSVAATLLAIAAALAAPAGAGNLYKWVDEQGHVRYGDRIPPQYAGRRQQRLNDQGIVIETRSAAKTPEERAQERRAAERAAEEEQLRRERAQHDHMLLSTFSTEDDMVMTRDGKIAAIKAAIQLAQARAEKTRHRVADLTRRAADIERSGKPVPDELRRQIADARAIVEQNEAYIEHRQNEQEEIRRKFDADLQRFRELKAKQERSEAANVDRSSSPANQGAHALVGK